MSIEVGDWVLVQGGTVAHVVAREEGAHGPLLRAETLGGVIVERPVSYAELRWQCIPENGLAVQRALDPGRVEQMVAHDPVELVVAALRDAEGTKANATDLKAALTPSPIPEADFTRWWKRVQPRLNRDGRFDTSKARERIYRLLGPNEHARNRRPELVSNETRAGRRLADAPLLLEARKLAKRSVAPTPDERPPLDAEAGLASLPALDPTDRFLAAELGVWLGLWSVEDAIELLGDDLLLVDLTRVRERASRDAAIDWAIAWSSNRERPFAADDALVRSAMAAGAPWSDRVAEFASSRAPLLEHVLAWGIPGSEEAGPPKYPADLETYEKRVRRAGALVAAADFEEAAALGRGARQALSTLAPSGVHAKPRRRLLTDIARLFWTTWGHQGRDQRARSFAGSMLAPDAWDVLIELAPQDALTELRAAFEEAYASDHAALAPAIRTLGERLRLDPGAIALGVARRQIEKTGALKLALEAARITSEAATRNDSVTLAGAIAPHDSDIQREIARSADRAAQAILDGVVIADGTLLFTPDSWRDLAERLARDAEGAREHARRAVTERAAALDELERTRAYADERQEELRRLRSEAGAQTQGNVVRVAANLLRPVAAAVADSYEADDLGALRDRLLAVLERAQIEEATGVGDVQRFNPVRHRWVDEGNPSVWVRALSPAYATHQEGGDEVILVQARVVAAEAPR